MNVTTLVVIPTDHLTTYDVVPSPKPDPSANWTHGSTPELSQLELLGAAYTSVHGPLSLGTCALGIPMNVVNITVLTRKCMRTPVNCMLTWLAVFDLLTMTSYVPFSLHFYCLTDPWRVSPHRNSQGWMMFLLFHVGFTSTTHTVSVWLGVALAIFRYKHVFSPAKGHLTRARRLVKARVAVAAVVVVSVVVMVPNYMMNRLLPLEWRLPGSNTSDQVFVTEPLNLGTTQMKPLTEINMWLHAGLAKFLPCILLVIYGGLLMRTLRTRRPGMASLQHPRHSGAGSTTSGIGSSIAIGSTSGIVSSAGIGSTSAIGSVGKNKTRKPLSGTGFASHGSSHLTVVPYRVSSSHSVQSQGCQDKRRTTRMLLAVIILYLLTEIPQGVLICLSATLPGFFHSVYIPLGDVMDLIALVNNAINFLLYCVMSRDFRVTLLDMVKAVAARCKVSNGGHMNRSRHTTASSIFERPNQVVSSMRAKSHSFS